jgi:uncharacterized Zn finger protein
MTAPLSDDEIQAALAEVALAHMRTSTSGCHCGAMRLGQSYPKHLAAALLPVVRDIAAREAARDLEAAANWMQTVHREPHAAHKLRARALGLDPTHGKAAT